MNVHNNQHRKDPTRGRHAIFWVAAVAVFLLVIFLTQIFAPSTETKEGGYFSGQIPGVGDVYLRLTIDRTNVTGTADFSVHMLSSRLVGERVPSGRLRFYAIGSGRDDDQTNGIFSGEILGNPPVFHCQWMTNGGSPVDFELHQIAVTRELQRHTGFRIGRYGGTKSFDTIFPEFTSSRPFHQAVNTRLRADAVDALTNFVGDGFGHAVEGVRFPSDYINDYEAKDVFEVSFFSDKIVSLRVSRSEYTGGAHHNYGVRGLNFVVDGTKLREIRLADLFEPESDWETLLSKLIIADLERQNASGVEGGMITNMSAASLPNFNIGPAGMIFYFDPYVVGSFAEGEFTVTLPWETLRPCFRSNSLPMW